MINPSSQVSHPGNDKIGNDEIDMKYSSIVRTSTGGLLRLRLQANDLHVVTNFKGTCFNTSSDDCTTAADAKGVLNGHQKRFVSFSDRSRNAVLHCIHKFKNGFFTYFVVGASRGSKCRTRHDFNVITRKFVK